MCLLMADDASRPTVGRLNCEAALQVLAEEGFSVSPHPAWEATRGVNIQFNTETGEVLLRRLDRAQARRGVEQHEGIASDAGSAR